MAAIPLEDEFADIIAKARFGLGKTVGDVSKASGVSDGDIRALENYERPPTEAEVRAIAAAVELHPGRLLAIANDTWSPKEEAIDGDEHAQVVRLKNFVGGYPVYSYLLVCRRTGEVAIVDTAADAEQAMTAVRERKLTPTAILVTHGHADHVEGLDDIQSAFDVPVVLGEDLSPPPGVDDSVKLREGDTYSIGKLDVHLLKTPGHSAGCATFVAGSVALCGDVIFAGSVGRPNHSYPAIRSSIVDKLFALPDSTRLYAGHGPSTTVGEEKSHNPFFG